MLSIVGAGMAGLLAANMLHRMEPVVFERQAKLPNNHTAVLRFRSTKVADVLGIPFRKVTMIKSAVSWNNPIADALAYSFKATGQYRSDRSIVSGTVVDTRYVAPADLIMRMARQIPSDAILLNREFDYDGDWQQPIISTIPMPRLMEILGYRGPQFRHHSGRNIHAQIADCDAYVSLLVPDPANPITRISITGSEAIIESVESDWSNVGIITSASALLGIPEDKFSSITVHQQPYAKIQPIDDNIRKDFMYWATDHRGIFSLGRFATWRPGLLADDMVQDVTRISGWINDRYSMAKAR
jgi:hypothetical protein